MFSCANAALLFIAYFSLSVLNALYVRNVMSRRAALAATIGAGSTLVSAFGVITFSENPAYMLPMAAGSWLGIYGAVTYLSSK